MVEAVAEHVVFADEVALGPVGPAGAPIEVLAGLALVFGFAHVEIVLEGGVFEGRGAFLSGDRKLVRLDVDCVAVREAERVAQLFGEIVVAPGELNNVMLDARGGEVTAGDFDGQFEASAGAVAAGVGAY